MTRYQRAKRYAYWRGLALALLVFTGFCFVSGLAGHITGEQPATTIPHHQR